MSSAGRPSFTELVDWLDGRLRGPRAAQVAAQVEVDPRTQEAVSWIRAFLDTADEAPLVRPPEHLRNALRAMFQDRDRTPAVGPDRLVLLFDSRRDHQLTGVRALDTDCGVQLAFTGETADLVLDVDPLPDGMARIRGQLFVAESKPGVIEVSVRVADIEVHGSSSDDVLGRFVVDRVPADAMQVRVRSGGLDVLVEADLSVGRTQP